MTGFTVLDKGKVVAKARLGKVIRHPDGKPKAVRCWLLDSRLSKPGELIRTNLRPCIDSKLSSTAAHVVKAINELHPGSVILTRQDRGRFAPLPRQYRRAA